MVSSILLRMRKEVNTSSQDRNTEPQHGHGIHLTRISEKTSLSSLLDYNLVESMCILYTYDTGIPALNLLIVGVQINLYLT